MRCTAHTHTHTSILQNSFKTASPVLEMNNEREGSGQGMLAQSLAKVSAIIITVCTQSGCVCVLSYSIFAILWGNQGNLAPTILEDSFGQSKYTASAFLEPPSLYFHWRGQDTGVRGGRDGNNGCCSERTVVISGHWTQGWRRVGVEVIITTENRISFHFSFHFSFGSS